jgi:iron(III) transport system substrate-binding protein
MNHLAWRRAGLGALAAITLGAALPAHAEGVVNVYTNREPGLYSATLDEFAKATGIKVNAIFSEQGLAERIKAEGENSPADVLITVDIGRLQQALDLDIAQPVRSEALASNIPANLRDPEGRWFALSLRARTVYASKERVPETAITYEDLADPKWKGKIGMSPGGADFQAIVSAVLELKGEAATAQWLKGLKENAKIYQGNTTVMKAVNAGEIAGGIIYHYYWYKDRAESGANSKDVELHFFGKQDPGAFVSVSGAGVLQSSKHAAEAQQLVEYLTSKAGQKVLADSPALEYTVGKDSPANAKLKPLASLQAPTVDAAQLNGPKVVELMQEASLL